MNPVASDLILCDADIVIDLDRGYAPARRWAEGLEAPLTIAGVARLELVESRPTRAALLKIHRMITQMPTLWPPDEWCDYAVELMVQFNLSHGLQKYDALVAVTALAAGVPLHTFNVRHFHFIPGLLTVQPYGKSAGTGEQ